MFAEAPNTRIEFLRAIQTAIAGTYALRCLAPGVYRVLAMEEFDRDEVLEDGSLGIYDRAATRVRIAEAERATSPLRLPVTELSGSGP